MKFLDRIKGMCKAIRNKIGLKKYDIDGVLKRIEEMRDKATPGTDEWRHLALDYEKELENKKLAQELRFLGVPLKTIIAIVALLVVTGFAFCLDMDSPKAVGIAAKVISIFKHEMI